MIDLPALKLHTLPDHLRVGIYSNLDELSELKTWLDCNQDAPATVRRVVEARIHKLDEETRPFMQQSFDGAAEYWS